MKSIVNMLVIFSLFFVQLLGQTNSKIDRFLKILSLQRDLNSPFLAETKTESFPQLPLAAVFTEEVFFRDFGISISDPDPKIRALVKLSNPAQFIETTSIKIKLHV